MEYFKTQIEDAEKGLFILRKYGLVYLAGEERTGKTLTSIKICEDSKAKNILIITKVAAVKDWKKTIAKFNKNYFVVTYGKAKNFKLFKPDLIILDEAHNYISGYPKKSKTVKALEPLTKGKPIIYMSATPYAETLAQIYHQFSLSSYSPFSKYSSFYSWHKRFGVEEWTHLPGRKVKKYSSVNKTEILSIIDHLFIRRKRKTIPELRYEPEDELIYFNLNPETKELSSIILKDRVLPVKGKLRLIETKMEALSMIAMLEGGAIKYVKDKIILDDKGKTKKIYSTVDTKNREKVDKIKEIFGDTDDLVIMYNYHSDRFVLEKEFKHAVLLQAETFSEGVDLSSYSNIVIYSMNWKTSKYIQRRCRQINKNRDKKIVVYYLICKGGISEKVYKAVTLKKVNFTASLYGEM